MNEPNNAYGSGWSNTEDNDSGTGSQSSNWQTDNLEDGYQENPHQSNFLDTPYSESFAHPDGEKSKSSGWEME